MRLSPREMDKLALHAAGALAQKRLARGVRLNLPEATALIASVLLELIRDGADGENLGVADLMDRGRRMLGRRHVLPSVPDVLVEVQVEGTFPDGTKLVTVHDPIATDDGDVALALYGSFLPTPAADAFPPVGASGIGKASGKKRKANDGASDGDIPDALALGPPGAVRALDGDLVLNEGRDGVMLKVTNTGDRPIQVGSHYHMIECNALLSFDRRLALGRRLNVPAGTAVRFEPGESKSVPVVPIAGRRAVYGGNNLVDGPADAGRRREGDGRRRRRRVPSRAHRGSSDRRAAAHHLARQVRDDVRPDGGG